LSVTPSIASVIWLPERETTTPSIRTRASRATASGCAKVVPAVADRPVKARDVVTAGRREHDLFPGGRRGHDEAVVVVGDPHHAGRDAGRRPLCVDRGLQVVHVHVARDRDRGAAGTTAEPIVKLPVNAAPPLKAWAKVWSAVAVLPDENLRAAASCSTTSSNGRTRPRSRRSR
jgi:hypothetical protein